MVKVRGQNSNRNTVEQTAENGQKISGDDDAAGIASWCQASRMQGCRIVLNSTGRNMFSTGVGVRNDSGWSWTFRIARVTLHDCEVAPLVPQKLAHAIFFAVCLIVFQYEIWRRTLTIEFYGKKVYQIRAYGLGVQFSFNTCLTDSVWRGRKRKNVEV